MSAEPTESLPQPPADWPFPHNPRRDAWARAQAAKCGPLTDEQIRRIAPLVQAAIGAPSSTRTAS